MGQHAAAPPPPIIRTATAQLDVRRMSIFRANADIAGAIRRALEAPGALAGPNDSLLLWATIGYASYLRNNGSVWIEEEDPAGPGDASDLAWRIRPATAQEAWANVHAARQRHPALASMLSDRPASSFECATCFGTGAFTVEGTTVSAIRCGTCHGLGWIVPNTV